MSHCNKTYLYEDRNKNAFLQKIIDDNKKVIQSIQDFRSNVYYLAFY